MKKVLTILILFLTTALFAQRFTFDGKKSVVMMEARAIINFENNKFVVNMVLPGGDGEGEQKVDLQKGDEVIFVNGKKAKSVEELRKLYEDIKVGDEVKLGIDRKGTKFFVTFKRNEANIVKGGKNIKIGGSAIMMGPDGKARDAQGKEISKEKLQEIKKHMESKDKSDKTVIERK